MFLFESFRFFKSSGGLMKINNLARYFTPTVVGAALLLGQGGFIQKASAYTLITDIDDTLKISNVSSYFGVIRYGLFGKQMFAGTRELMRELAKNADHVIYLSGSPQEIKSRLQSLLIDQGGFPAGEFRLRDWFETASSASFKRAELEVIAHEGGSSFVFLGDDTESDPEVYTGFLAHHPKVESLGTYIHQVNARNLPSGVTPFVTAFDVALEETEKGRLRPEQALMVGEAVLKAPQKDLIFPSFKNCPKSFNLPLGPIASQDLRLVEMRQQILNRVHSYCAPFVLDTQVLSETQDPGDLETAYARLKEESILRITSDALSSASDLRIGLDENQSIVSFRFVTSRDMSVYFTPDQLEKGIVLYHKSNYDILTLSSVRFLADAGGTLNLIYLTNGMTESYSNLLIGLYKVNGKWTFMTNEGVSSRPFTEMFLKAKKVPLFGMVGIEKIELR